jgi:hypothetical protein
MTFTEFIQSRRITDSPRGDFIEDTKALIGGNRFPDPRSLPVLEWFIVRRHGYSRRNLELVS